MQWLGFTPSETGKSTPNGKLLLRELAAEYGLSRESSRRIECVEEQRLDRIRRGFDLSGKARGAIRFVLYHAGLDRTGIMADNDFKSEAKVVARQVAEVGREAFDRPDRWGAKIAGKRTLAEIEAWIGEYGYRWGTGI